MYSIKRTFSISLLGKDMEAKSANFSQYLYYTQLDIKSNNMKWSFIAQKVFHFLLSDILLSPFQKHYNFLFYCKLLKYSICYWILIISSYQPGITNILQDFYKEIKRYMRIVHSYSSVCKLILQHLQKYVTIFILIFVQNDIRSRKETYILIILYRVLQQQYF